MRQLGTRDQGPAGLTPIDIAWIEQRVAVTLAANDIVCDIENGFMTISGPNGTSAPISLAPLGEQLTKIDRAQWSGYTWEWCVQTLASPVHTAVSAAPDEMEYESVQLSSMLDIEAQIDELMGGPAVIDDPVLPSAPPAVDPGVDAQPITLAEILTMNREAPATPRSQSKHRGAGPLGLTPSIDLEAIEVFDVEDAIQQTLDELDAVTVLPVIVEPTPVAEPIAPAVPLADVIGELSVRIVSEAVATTMPVAALTETSVPNMFAALSSGNGQWVTSAHLDAWGITRDMALGMAETRVLGLSPDVTIVFLDDSTPVYVIETEGPDVASLLPYVDAHVPIADGAEVTIALANDQVMFVHVAPSERPMQCLQLLIDAATAEYSQRPGMASPAVFTWSAGGELAGLVSGLQTAAGRLSARALVGSAV